MRPGLCPATGHGLRAGPGALGLVAQIGMAGGPAEGGAIGVGRVGGSKDDRRGCAVTTSGAKRGRYVGKRAALRAEAVDSAGGCELRGPQALDEVAAAHPPRLLGGSQHPVDAGEATRNPFCDNGATGHDAIAIEENLGRGIGADGGIGLDRRQQGPTAGGGGRAGAPWHRGSTDGEPPTGQRAEAACAAGVSGAYGGRCAGRCAPCVHPRAAPATGRGCRC